MIRNLGRTTRGRTAVAALLRGLRRGWPALLALALIGALALAATSAVALWRAFRDNRTIADLADGRDVAVDEDAAPQVLLARAVFLLRHDRIDDAQALAGPLARTAPPRLVAAYHLEIADARLRRAITFLESSRIDPAIPQVTLAKDAYRQALRIDPALWNAKYDLDVAMRLVRDFPQLHLDESDEPPPATKRLWTDLPGQPQGLP